MCETRRAAELIRALTGADPGSYKSNILNRRLLARTKSLGLGSVTEYLDGLHAGDPRAAREARRLVASLSVPVSEFFRDPEVFATLEEKAYPELFRARAGHEALGIWCVGCSRGQEAYSLAISLHRAATRHGFRGEISILATDVDAAALRTARQGVYPERLLVGLPAALRRETFDALGGDRWRVREPYRQLVRFERSDALASGPPEGDGWFDLITCRNLLIYLRRSVQQELILRLRDALRPGGFLVLGASETVLGKPWDRFEHVDPTRRVYRRPPEASPP